MPFSPIVEKAGSLSAVGWAKETIFGTPVVAGTFLPDTGCTIESDPGWFSPQVMTGIRDLQRFNMYGEAKYTGNVEGPLFPSMGIALLKAAIGTDAVTGTVAPYTHTITENQTGTLDSLTIEKNTGGFESLQFAGCRIGKYSLKVASGNQAATVTADVVGQSALVLTTPTALSYVNEIPFEFAEATMVLDSHSRYEANNFQVDIDNGLKESYTFSGEHGPNFITPVTLKVSGSFDVIWDSFTDATYGDYNAMESGTLGALSLSLAHPGGGASVALSMPTVALSKYKTDIKISDVVASTISFEASAALTGSTYTIQAVVMNNVATAY